ncbi:hypothetical protein [Boseongicola aestuarii]|uniref:Uncharacterized protein n=1 Tax=Boseongicola aestuarii TaxID=1470561 RepID=A0A238IUW4_9RHOB|nr:hypothetical protein [Boseongicola aestuarii]SMX22107.1 hypothetical protein BOA8489_00197 [Boseongicola aestuarii]
MSGALDHVSGVIAVLFCGCAALFSLSVLTQTRDWRPRADHLPDETWLGVVAILGWGWMGALMAEVANARLMLLAVSLAFGLIARIVVERQSNLQEDRIILGGITLLPLGALLFS